LTGGNVSIWQRTLTIGATFALLTATVLLIYAQQPADPPTPTGSEPPLFLAVDVAPPGTPTLRTIYTFAPPNGAIPNGLVIGKGGVLYGTASAVFSLTPPASPGSAWTEVVLYDGFTNCGEFCSTGVVIGNGGVLYGATETGGMNSCLEGCGTVFSVSPPASPGGAWTEAVLYSFEGATDGFGPNGVVISKSGVLYGTTSGGGTGTACYGGCGTVFSLTPPASPGGLWSKAVLHNFGGRDGQYPSAPVVIGSGGVLYGTASYGGTGSCPGVSGGCGTVFSLRPPASLGGPWTERVLHSFTNTGDGYEPIAGLVIGSGGVLYGTTARGGTIFGGTVFSLTPPASPGGLWTEAVVHSFTGAPDGQYPSAPVVIGSNVVLYGTELGGSPTCAAYECGTVFSLTPPAALGSEWTEAVLYSFTGGKTGGQPLAGVVITKSGVLYGTTEYGGNAYYCIEGCGTVFALKP
jgi:hypothetical protein